MRTPFFLVVLLVVVATTPAALAGDFSEAAFEESRQVLSLFAETSFNSDDLELGLAGRVGINPVPGLGVFASFFGRPYGKHVRRQVRPHFFEERHETRYFLGTGLDMRWLLATWFNPYASIGGGYTWGGYSGLKTSPQEGWIPLLQLGVLWRLALDPSTSLGLRVGYQYLDLKSSPGNRCQISLVLITGDLGSGS